MKSPAQLAVACLKPGDCGKETPLCHTFVKGGSRTCQAPFFVTNPISRSCRQRALRLVSVGQVGTANGLGTREPAVRSQLDN